MSRLSKDETIFIKEHLEGLTDSEAPNKSGLTDVETDLIHTVLSLYEENEQLQEDKTSYQKFIANLFDSLLEHKDKDGYCRMMLKGDEVEEILASLPEIPKNLRGSVTHEG